MESVCHAVVDCCKTDMDEEIEGRFYHMIRVAPWTSLDLSGESAMSDE